MRTANSLLLVTHVLVRQGPNGPQIDDQTAAGIAQWRRYFDKVTYVGIGDDVHAGGSSTVWVDAPPGAQLIGLPKAYRLPAMARAYRSVRRQLADAIATHEHLCFTIGGLVGDWPALAAIEAIRQKRKYAAWLDRVEPPIIRNRLAGRPFPIRIAAEATFPITEAYSRHILKHSSIALLQGMDTYNHYAASAPAPHCTYDTHTHVADEISADAITAKQARITSGSPLEIVYVGRAAAMKGPDDWLGALELLARNDIPFNATWYGDGPDLARMQARVEASGLSASIRLAGFEGDREVLLSALRASDLLLFCHKTPESARCLVEALVCGCPLIGYGTDYPKGLIAQHGGGSFVPHDPASLAAHLTELHADRPTLANMVAQAAASGKLYNEDSVYRHRAELMRSAATA